MKILGRLGKVLEVHEGGDLIVEVEDDRWHLNPISVTKVEREGEDEDSDSDTHGAAGFESMLINLH